ncbi:6-phosphogluconolactonase [Seongchinamella unica]|uniref:6-phosphogluconolactonase n=1 Tax=Seongchinamella unica TaxID=2547392 RepID=A0A4R5LVN8_9GAMM|nr:6-phosphogluconolactonase [Seongchinamella unica]TDG15480.1 6-phosphogluconolactonase [Seongchinamella unica]
MSKQHSFSDRPALDTALAAHIAERLAADIASRGKASLAVSGGSTPQGMFAALSRQHLPWDQVWITLVDERWVDADSPDSNEKLVRENLLQNAAAEAHFIGLKGNAADAAAGLQEVTARLDELPLPLSCAVLGMGGDGHTASWFPQASNLQQLIDPRGEALLGCCDPVTAPHQRITFTLPAILAAGEIILHITGEEKRAILAEASEKRYPIAAITEQQSNPASIWWAP